MILLTSVGIIFLGLGAIGIFLPIWPTTPFVLLAVASFSAAPRIRAYILTIPFFGEHVKNYEERTGLSPRTVSISMAWLWGMLLISAVLGRTLWMAVLLFVVGFAVTWHILYMAKGRRRAQTE